MEGGGSLQTAPAVGTVIFSLHRMKGTWRYFKSEKRVIEEENLFRQDLARMQGRRAKLRFAKVG